MTRPTFVSLFSGVGGLDLGLERAGWRCVAQVEVDPFCQRVLARHWPEVPRWGDIREVNPDDLPRADLVCGGFPCQPVSLAGRGLAQEDERWLWPEAARLVRHLRPRWVLLENVPGLLARGMGDVLGDLAACGYDAEWDCVPASAVGANHRRDRVWVVAYPGGQRHGPLAGGPHGDAGGNGPDRAVESRRGGADVADPQRLGEPLRAAEGRRPRRPPGGGQPADVEDPDRLAVGQGRRGRGTPEAGQLPDPLGVQLRDQPGRRDGQGRPGAAVAGDDGPSRPLADPDGAGRWQGSRLGWVRPTIERDGWWAAEPDVGRVAHGVPARVDRLSALGNAVVPQVAEHVGRLILHAHMRQMVTRGG